MSGLKPHVEVAQLSDDKRHEIEMKLDALKDNDHDEESNID